MNINTISKFVLASLMTLPLALSSSTGCGDDAQPGEGDDTTESTGDGDPGDGDGAPGDGDGAPGDGDGAPGDGDGAPGDGDGTPGDGDGTPGDGDGTPGDGDGAPGDGDGDGAPGDGDGDGDPDLCLTCLETNCDEFLMGCFVDPNCTCWNDCVTSGQNYGTCIGECGGPPSQEFNALAMCIDQFCVLECEGG